MPGALATETRDRPVALVLTRQDVSTLDRTLYASAEGLRRGAYVLCEAANSTPDLILIATGSEVDLIVEAQKLLQKEGIRARLVSMPSWELFEIQTEDYRRTVFPPSIRARLARRGGRDPGVAPLHRRMGRRDRSRSFRCLRARIDSDAGIRIYRGQRLSTGTRGSGEKPCLIQGRT